MFLGKICLNFSTLILSALPNMMHFFSRIFDYANMRAEDVRLIANEEIRNYGKIVYIKNIFENGRWEDAYFSS